MDINLSSISNAQTTALGLSNLVLVSPQVNKGIRAQKSGGELGEPLLFHYQADEDITLSSDITDQYVESNISVSDQIALKPEIYRVRGLIGELNNVIPETERALLLIKNKLTYLTALEPELSPSALAMFNRAFSAYQFAQSVINSAESTWKTINGEDSIAVIGSEGIIEGSATANQNKQQIIFQQIFSYWRNRTLFTVQTPWAIFQNMAISSARILQEENTNMISDIEITFKMIRFASTEKVSGSINTQDNGTGRTAQQGSKTVNLGVEKLKPSPMSIQSMVGQLRG